MKIHLGHIIKSKLRLIRFCLILVLIGLSSCVTYKDFSKAYQIPKPIDFSDTMVQNSFEVDNVYRITLKDNRELDFVVKEVGKSSLKGILKNSKINRKIELAELLEIPFENIGNSKKRVPDNLASLAAIAIPVGVIYLYVAYSINSMFFTFDLF
ncbi:hypothetical protein [Aquiflexum sp.]|uniref:hypothetical protein n=1 Tax=Aquiflexum sp. TaxID=1872584 RepID=UPI0035940711